MEAALSDVVVIDLSRVLAGPYCTMILGDLGAEVIKVERPGEGDETRLLPPLKNGESHYFASINKDKRSVAIDIKPARGRELVLELARHSDVLVENFRPGVADRLGVGY